METFSSAKAPLPSQHEFWSRYQETPTAHQQLYRLFFLSSNNEFAVVMYRVHKNKEKVGYLLFFITLHKRKTSHIEKYFYWHYILKSHSQNEVYCANV